METKMNRKSTGSVACKATSQVHPRLFRQFQGEVRRIHLPRTRVNRTAVGPEYRSFPSPRGHEMCNMPRTTFGYDGGGPPRARVEEGTLARRRGAARAVRRLWDRPGGGIGPGVVRGASQASVPGAASGVLPSGVPLLRAGGRRSLPHPQLSGGLLSAFGFPLGSQRVNFREFPFHALGCIEGKKMSALGLTC